MKPRHLIAATIIAAVGIAAALDARTPTSAAARAPEGADGQAVPRKYWLLTPVALDALGRVTTAGRPVILDAQAAYRLADMLAAEEAREAAGVGRAGESGQAPDAGQRRRCAAIAASTGEQCRLYARPGSAYCRLHDPNYRD